MKQTLTLLCLLPAVYGLVTPRRSVLSLPQSAIFSSVEGDNNPCWQDLYDDDCSMDSVYGASFVASEWIKEMPCAAGVEDCDMPEDLKVPGNRQEEGADGVDVMEFLNLKRAPELGKTSGEKDATP
eukprot:CAMPEP_0117038568 /NCGR_PEP_ID=MMETSP0472-20121206/27126_1 /TAXON_ID=693140 ORGANISM="Tiarina fusus, Strain LIS" /NCGR_SAMPLE_ID=MMETSP0472 /ASSEMBLY_ACC=CAM_ASM_000603 /LENGTH=125 /DNA_ID=CAMNT_0004748823 /DNA_START=68 /DNA_END=445 /DNA_ORIENTATION=-